MDRLVTFLLLVAVTVSFPVERVAIGRATQTRFLPGTRPLWAPGVLGFHQSGRVVFVPSSRRRDDRVWEATVHRIELVPFARSRTAVRLHGDHPGQFTSDLPVTKLREPLTQWIPIEVADGLTPPDAPPGGSIVEDRPALDPVLAERATAGFGERRDLAIELVSSYGAAGHHREPERVRRAVLALADGDLDRLRHFLDVADTDFRDVLAWSDEPPPT